MNDDMNKYISELCKKYSSINQFQIKDRNNLIINEFANHYKITYEQAGVYFKEFSASKSRSL